MSDELFEVPLFPLNVVLFPGMALPLHIFEHRYRDMTADCLADQAPFGVVLAQADDADDDVVPARVGTLARIADYEQLPDGRYNMLALGTSRFEVIDYKTSKAYLVGIVRPLRDHVESAGDLDDLVKRAREALNDYLRAMLTLVGSEDRHIEVPGEAHDLSYLIGTCLMCEDHEKQQLLETTSLPQRLKIGTSLLRAEVEQLTSQIELGLRVSTDFDRSLLN
ncbi:MAG: LON peptidase substrate-binding domain-containing protein [Ktedonobacterales bacterium]